MCLLKCPLYILTIQRNNQPKLIFLTMILRKLDNGRFTNLLTSPRNLTLLAYNLGKGKSDFSAIIH